MLNFLCSRSSGCALRTNAARDALDRRTTHCHPEMVRASALAAKRQVAMRAIYSPVDCRLRLKRHVLQTSVPPARLGRLPGEKQCQRFKASLATRHSVPENLAKTEQQWCIDIFRCSCTDPVWLRSAEDVLLPCVARNSIDLPRPARVSCSFHGRYIAGVDHCHALYTPAQQPGLANCCRERHGAN
jgi:hypothetical protein